MDCFKTKVQVSFFRPDEVSTSLVIYVQDFVNVQRQNWAFPKLILGTLPLTIDRRKKFNTLVININKAISEVVDEITKEKKVKYKIGTAGWDPWPQEGVKGQYCDPSSTGKYADEKQPDLQFFKPNTHVEPVIHDELRKRQILEQEREMLEAIERSTNIYDSLLYHSENPPAGALHRLNPRAPAPPGCPGDNKPDFTLGLGLADSFGKFFHPNELGHETITAFALETMIDQRAEVLGVAEPACEWKDEFKCWSKDGRKGYAGEGIMNKNYKTFCDEVKPPDNTVGWKFEKSYNEGTPDEHSFLIQLSSKASKFDKDECLRAFDGIVNGCDKDDPNNPMKWKFGGQYVQGEYSYEINIKRDNRPWPPITATHGSCEGWYKVFFSAYKLKGAGWSTWDKGDETIKPKMKDCLGLGITKWDFKYFDAPDKDGMEWQLNFNTPIWVKARCFANNKVAIGAGGHTGGCKGNDA